MTDLLAARSQMAMSLGFHIVFAVIGIGMPLLMVIAERRWQVTRDAHYLELARRWAKGTAILFAVGAVSGTVLSFELGLLWPGFMEFAGPIIGMPFSLEGFAFFMEAIFLGIYLYGWDRISERAHLVAGIMVAASGALSGVFVVIANAWMNAPTGFTLVNGVATGIDPIAALGTPAAFPQTLHMTLAAYAATGFGAAGIHAAMLLRQRANAFHLRGLRVALLMAIPAALLQPISGHHSAGFVAESQPAKFAAMESLFTTQARAPLLIGGWPDPERGEVRYGVELPGALSFLATNDFNATITGLDQVPRDEWPNVRVTHLAFQVMVGLGMFMIVAALLSLVAMLRQDDLGERPLLLKLLVLASPMGFLATEAGWVVTEVGRQPWVIQGVLRTADAVTPMPGLVVPFLGFTLLYIFLAVAVVWLLRRQILGAPDAVDWRRRHAPLVATTRHE
ncbi:MAG TPA: cytochrome ubiquinol oxidase subunit I [Gemmatimonadales bacterium]|jgi:cytochrome d ubiquinol oxidase subunit I|nr:cytochrome ubiquinol oxidase subunit I [Gemmatimonadales bacterium]